MLLPGKPAPHLRDLVRSYFHVEVFLTDSSMGWPIPARSIPCIEFTFGEPYRIHHLDGSLVEITYPATLIGAKTRQKIRLELRQHVETFVIMFQPTGLQRLFSLPIPELINQHYEASLVMGRKMERLHSRLGEVNRFAERVLIADEELSALMPGVDRECRIDSVVQAISASNGCIRIPDLANQAGISLRQFERRFLAELGITPKLYARIVRFEAALAKKAASPGCDWTRIAYELGYHDQMHMIHDFEQLSGSSPKSLTKDLEFLKAYGGTSN